MKNKRPQQGSKSSTGNQSGPKSISSKMDLKDSPEDEKRLQPDETIIDLPDVKDIPGQEFVHVPSLGALADTTISSADEEGEGLFDDEEDADIMMGTEADIPKEDKNMLENTFETMQTTDERRLGRASLDNTDFEGEGLNEGSFGELRSGSDLDIPDEVDETKTDAMGQGDEENKFYSLGSDENDNVTEGTT